MFWDRLFINIYQILDKNTDVLSLKNFFKNCKKIDKWKEIEQENVFKKIKFIRHKCLAHKNFSLALHLEDNLEHYNKNKLHLIEILDFMKLLQKNFEAVFDKVCSIPTRHYALGKTEEEKEFRELLDLVFSGKNTSSA